MSAPERATGDVGLDGIDLTRRELFRRGFPHEVFARLRREAPVWWQRAAADPAQTGGRGFWVLSRHADIQAVSRAPDAFSALDGPGLYERPQQSGLMLTTMDGPPHVRMRGLINAGFTPRMTARLEDQARAWAVSIVEEALERGRCDFVSDVAYPLPLHMIADIVGIPAADREPLFALANDFMMCTDPEHPVPVSERSRLEREMFDYARRLGEEKRRAPADDVWTILTRAELDGPDGQRERLGAAELDLFFLLLTVAGSETTRNVIALGLRALLDHPEQLERLRREPALSRSATEELIRWASPVSYFRRTALRDAVIRGAKIAAGDRVTVWYPSGNRDEEVFGDPGRLDLARSPNHHVAFGGGGPHFCLGAHLARREISILFEELLARVREIEPLGEVTYSVQGIDNPIVVSPRELPVRLTPA